MVKYKKKLGQHFLHDKNIISKIIKAIDPKKKDNFLEIGPGDGALTYPLIDKISKMTIVEKDKELIPLLKNNLSNYHNIDIINADILKYNLDNLSNTNIRIVGNLPYNISTEIIFKLSSYSSLFIDAHFMLQKEVVDRIVSKHGSKIYGRLSIMSQAYFVVKKLFDISPNVFYPKPKVNSSYLRLIPKKFPFKDLEHKKRFADIVNFAFMSRRKMIKSSLSNYISRTALKDLNIDPDLRPEMLSLTNFMDISNQ